MLRCVVFWKDYGGVKVCWQSYLVERQVTALSRGYILFVKTRDDARYTSPLFLVATVLPLIDS